jgi:phosphoesterase RecJ-like protein
VSDNGATSSREQALATLRGNDKFLLTTHERPDGDAIGSLAAMQQVLTTLGTDSLAFLTADEFPLPYE